MSKEVGEHLVDVVVKCRKCGTSVPTQDDEGRQLLVDNQAFLAAHPRCEVAKESPLSNYEILPVKNWQQVASMTPAERDAYILKMDEKIKEAEAKIALEQAERDFGDKPQHNWVSGVNQDAAECNRCHLVITGLDMIQQYPVIKTWDEHKKAQQPCVGRKMPTMTDIDKQVRPEKPIALGESGVFQNPWAEAGKRPSMNSAAIEKAMAELWVKAKENDDKPDLVQDHPGWIGGAFEFQDDGSVTWHGPKAAAALISGRPCECGAAKTANPNLHSDWCPGR